MTDLGVFEGDQCSIAYAINSNGQTVGSSDDCSGNNAHALMWDRGHLIDLNTFVPFGSGVQLTVALNINEGGGIAAQGVLSNGDLHAFLLTPCDEKHPGQCQGYSMVEAPTPQTGTPVAGYPVVIRQGRESLISPVNQLRNQLMQRYHIPGQPAAPRD